MNRQLRLLIVIAFIVIILGVVAAFVLPNLNNTDDPADTTTTTVGNEVDPDTQSTIVPTPEPIETVQIVVALQNIARGAEIPPDPNIIGLREMPLEFLPQNALIGEEGLDFAIGQRARFDLFQEYPILSNMVVPSLSELASVGSDLAATIPPNRRAVAVPVNRMTSVAYGVQPGDRVDVIVSFLFVELDEDFQSILPNTTVVVNVVEGQLVFGPNVVGREGDPISARDNTTNQTSTFDTYEQPREQPRPRLATQITIQNALVVGTGDFPLDGILFELEPTAVPAEVATTAPQAPQQGGEAGPTVVPAIQPPNVITLAVTPQEAVLLTYYIEANIPFTFALRSANDTSQVPTTPVTLGYILTEYNIQLPERLPYSIEPAIRSIRSLRDIANTNTTELIGEEE